MSSCAGNLRKPGGYYVPMNETTPTERERQMLDELSNDELCTVTLNESQFTDELNRVDSFIESQVMTGSDLSHWISRSSILRQRLQGAEEPVQ